MGTSAALSVVIMAGTVAGLFPPRGHRGDEAGGRLGPPGLSLAAVTTAIYINQVLFTAYVIRVRHGDPSFIARYLPPGWFALARGPAVAALAHHFPDPGLLAPTVLRVQAFLELPNQSRFLHPVAESLGVYAQPLAGPRDRATCITGLRTQFEDHRHRVFPQLFGMRLP